MPRATRLYVQLQVDFDEDDKMVRLNRYGRDARALRDLVVAMWRYCKREKSDGNVPAEMIGKLVYPDSLKNGERDAQRLVDCGIAERTEEGYCLPGYLKHNKSRAQIEAESKEKAKAGAKGGVASGQSRRGEADPEQSASPTSEADGKQGGSHPRSQRTENSTDSTGVVSSLEGERLETLAAPSESVPPTITNFNRRRCTDHQGVANPPACAGCKAATERADREDAVAEDRERDRRERELEAARNACPDCDGTWLTDDEGKPTRKKCNHPKVRRAS